MKKKSVARLLGKKAAGVAMAGAVALAFTPALPALAAASDSGDYTYLYAALSYTDYYTNEGVLNGSSSASSTIADFVNTETPAYTQYDTGAYDAVSRATTTHGLQRGNYQGDITVYGKDGNTYSLAKWDGKSLVFSDGSTGLISGSTLTITKADGSTTTMDHYTVNGFKYVPVAVKTSDLGDFQSKYKTVENGGTVEGGYSEGALAAYSYTADVNAQTNGLKTATKNANGTYTFAARTTGTGSGIQGEAQKSIASDAAAAGKSVSDYLGATVRQGSGFGDNIRVDLLSNYGGLGAGMQAVKWEYLGNGDTVLGTYGTKFAADNWMHRKQGIQLGLTFGDRLQLPTGTDGSGKWRITLYALGYADTTVEVNIAASDIHANIADLNNLKAAVEKGQAVQQSEVTADSWTALQSAVSAASDLYDSADAILANEDTTVSNPRGAIYAAIENIDNAIVYPQSITATAKVKTVKASALKKKAKSYKLITVKGAKTTVSYAKQGGSKKLSVNKKNGKVTVKKGTKKGTYTAKVRVTAAAAANYASASKTVTVKVKVK